jgi:hypothetical protein
MAARSAAILFLGFSLNNRDDSNTPKTSQIISMTSLLFQQQIQLEAAQNYCLYYIGFK